MIREVLLSALSKSFRGRGMKIGTAPVIAVFPAAHPSVGDVTIRDDGNEATVSIGIITHQHFNPYDSSLSANQLAAWVTEEVVAFLEQLFADRILLQKGRTTNWGRMQRIGDGEDIPAIRDDCFAFLWSGPLN